MSGEPPFPVLVLRPEPGNAETVGRLTELGMEAVAAPLFAVKPVTWLPPPVADFDALLLSSANAVRHAGAGLSLLAELPSWCVGDATAAAAHKADLAVARVGAEGVSALLDGTSERLLWLCGEARTRLSAQDEQCVTAIPVYRTTELPFLPTVFDRPCIALLHSGRAARRFAGLVSERAHIAIVAISADVAAAAGAGWRSVTVAAHPSDAEMVAIAATLCQDRSRGMRQ